MSHSSPRSPFELIFLPISESLSQWKVRREYNIRRKVNRTNVCSTFFLSSFPMRAKFSFHDKAHLYSIRVHLNLAGRRGPTTSSDRNRCVDAIYAKEVTRHAPFDRIDINRFTEGECFIPSMRYQSRQGRLLRRKMERWYFCCRGERISSKIRISWKIETSKRDSFYWYSWFLRLTKRDKCGIHLICEITNPYNFSIRTSFCLSGVFQLNIHKVARHGRKVFYIYEDKANEDGYIFA